MFTLREKAAHIKAILIERSESRSMAVDPSTRFARSGLNDRNTSRFHFEIDSEMTIKFNTDKLFK